MPGRIAKAGKGVYIGPLDIVELAESRAATRALRVAQEADVVRKRLPESARIVALDERGQSRSSPDFAKLLTDWRDEGVGDAAFVIGGPDGLDTDFCS